MNAVSLDLAQFADRWVELVLSLLGIAGFTTFYFPNWAMENKLTLEELDYKFPNGFHDAGIISIELDYVAGTAILRLSLHVGFRDDPEPEREKYQEANLNLSGFCFCSIDPPDPNYPFLPKGKPISVGGDPAKADHLQSLPALSAKLPQGSWCYRYFVHNWNAFIYIAAKQAELTWIGTKPKYVD